MAHVSIDLPVYGLATPVTAADGPPLLFVVIDTEEEFDWSQPLSRERTSVDHLRRIDSLQRIFDRYDLQPTYVVDYPVASQPNGFEPLRDIATSGRAEIGAHMHPWVTPPLAEQVCGRNSFTGNLPVALQRQKLASLVAAIESNLGVRPHSYKAGRYGIGRDTLPLLDAFGFEVDQSVMPHFDFRSEDGPSFMAFSAQPFLFGERRMLALPCSSGYVGAAGPAAQTLYDFASSTVPSWLRLTGVVRRLGLADRLVLSPEGYSLDDMRRLTHALIADGTRVLTMTLHSPSIEPGHTPYVRSPAELAAFMDSITAYLDFFFGDLGGATTTPRAFRQHILGTITR